jgi:molybdenum cofactor cytidylyltransferase
MAESASALPIAAVVAAAGRSTRMGQPKQILPWGHSTVLATTVTNLMAAGAAPVICVVGHMADAIQATLDGTGARVLRNQDYLAGEMLSSYRAGVAVLSQDDMAYAGTLLALGDQPHISVAVLAQVVDRARQTPDALVIPSHKMRRGHPFYLPRRLWPELLALGEDESLRTLLRRHEALIRYVDVETDAILRDIDTPADYADLAPVPV